MKERIEKTFKRLREKNESALITFLTVGDPDLNTSLKIIRELPEMGADIIELGMPFSDPMADGPVIQRSYNRSLEKGIRIIDVFKVVEAFRKKNSSTPLILMGYYNPIFKYGVEKFIVDAKRKGLDGVLIVDFPPEADSEVEAKFFNLGLDFIRLATPTTKTDRFKKILNKTSGFLYYVSITGITGAKIDDLIDIEKNYKKLKRLSKLPFVIGFGINSPKKAKQMAKYADGVVVGSVLVKEVEKNLKNNNKIHKNILKLVSQYSKYIKMSRLETK